MSKLSIALRELEGLILETLLTFQYKAELCEKVHLRLIRNKETQVLERTYIEFSFPRETERIDLAGINEMRKEYEQLLFDSISLFEREHGTVSWIYCTYDEFVKETSTTAARYQVLNAGITLEAHRG